MKHEKHFFRSSLFAALTGILLSTSQFGTVNPLYNTAEAARRSVHHKKKRTAATEGKASFYAGQFHGRKTANGETFSGDEFTAAHPSLPFGTWVKVTNLSNGKDVVVRINDRGPFIKGRIIDLSVSAAKEIGIMQSGVVKVKLEALKPIPPSFVPG